jgi:hypothetical protein
MFRWNYNRRPHFVHFLATEDSHYKSFRSTTIRRTREKVNYDCDCARENVHFRPPIICTITDETLNWIVDRIYPRLCICTNDSFYIMSVCFVFTFICVLNNVYFSYLFISDVNANKCRSPDWIIVTHNVLEIWTRNRFTAKNNLSQKYGAHLVLSYHNS